MCEIWLKSVHNGLLYEYAKYNDFLYLSFPSLFTGRQHSLLCKSPVLVIVKLSVCLSLHLFVCHMQTCWHCVKMTQARITKYSPMDSPRTLVLAIKSWSRNSKGFTPSEGIKWEWGRKNLQYPANKSSYLGNNYSKTETHPYYRWLSCTIM